MSAKLVAPLGAILVAMSAIQSVQAGETLAADGWWGQPWPVLTDQAADVWAMPGGISQVDRDPFSAGAISFEFMTGYFPRAGVGPHTGFLDNPADNYLPQALRAGLMCNDPHPDRKVLAGVFEMLLEYDYAPIVRTFGNYFTGPSFLLRYNYGWPNRAFVPYSQFGAGLVFTDAWKDPAQRVIGQELEFLLRAEVGVHIMITDNWSFNIEGGYQHISNADLAKRNNGLNSFGGSVGFTRDFGK
jgi:hypothetical protein